MADYSNRVLRLEGIDWTDVEPAWLIALAQKGWREFSIKGKVTLTEITPTYYEQLMTVYGEHCFEPTAPLFIDAPPTVLMNVPDEIMEGQSVQFSAVLFPASDVVGTTSWSITSGSRTGTTLTTDGLLTTTENGAADSTLTIRCIFTVGTDVKVAYKNIIVKKYVYPTSVSLQVTKVDETHIRCDLECAGTNINTYPVCTWSLTGDAASKCSTEVSEDGLSFHITLVEALSEVYLQGTVSCVAKKLSGTTIATRTATIEFLNDTIAMTSTTNQYAMALMYSKGLAANQNYMTKAECALVTDSQLQTGASSSTSIFYSNSNFRNYCTSFNEFKYFTGLTKVPAFLFYSCKIQSIELPPQITEIGVSAFYDCSNLNSIPSLRSIAKIRSNAFCYCRSLKEIEINATTLESYSFRYCTGLKKVILGNGKTSLSSYTFANCPLLSEVILPSTLRTIAIGCFYDSAIKSITFPNTLTSIGELAFYNNPIISLHIPAALTDIATNAFRNHPQLEEITVDPNNTVYDSRNNCNAIYKKADASLFLACKNTVIQEETTAIGEYAYSYVAGGIMNIPNGVITIGAYAYEYSTFANFVIPNSVTQILTYAFSYCDSLTSIMIPNSVTSIGNGVCTQCKNLASVTLSNSLTEIPRSAFSGCSSLKNITLPNTITMIGMYAFRESGLTSLTIPASVESMENGVFENCYNLTSVTINAALTIIPAYTFFSCYLLSSINIPNTVTQLGAYAFDTCSALTSIVIPNSVTTLGDYVLRNCSKLTEIVVSDAVQKIPSYAFADCKNLVDVTLPKNLLSIASNAFAYCSKINKLRIPASLTTIDRYAFYNCGAIEIFFEGTTPAAVVGSWLISSDTKFYVPPQSLDDYKTASNWSLRASQIYPEVDITNVQSFTITADAQVDGMTKATLVNYTAIVDGTDNYLEEEVTGKALTGTAMSDEYGSNPSTTATRTVTISLTMFGETATTTATQTASPAEYVMVDLNSQWQESAKNPDTSAYESYESFSNYHVNSGVAKMTLTVYGYTSFTFYIRSNGESTYDYVQVGQLDQEPTPGTTSTSYAHTSGKQNSNTSLGNHIAVTFDNLDGGEHVITVIYRKDGSGDSGDDRGYVLIPKTYTIIEE